MQNEAAQESVKTSPGRRGIITGVIESNAITPVPLFAVGAQLEQTMAPSMAESTPSEPDKVSPAGIDTAPGAGVGSDIVAEVDRDIAECVRVNGAGSMFSQSDSKVRAALVPSYGLFRRANSDPAYCRVLAGRLFAEVGGERKPSEKKPWCLAARLALRPIDEDEVARTYEAAYYLRHAAIIDVSVADFSAWMSIRNRKPRVTLFARKIARAVVRKLGILSIRI